MKVIEPVIEHDWEDGIRDATHILLHPGSRHAGDSVVLNIARCLLAAQNLLERARMENVEIAELRKLRDHAMHDAAYQRAVGGAAGDVGGKVERAALVESAAYMYGPSEAERIFPKEPADA